MKKTNVISVNSPTFFVKRNDPTQVSYESQDLTEWKFVQTAYSYDDQKCTANDFLYIYEKERNMGIRGALLTPKHLTI